MKSYQNSKLREQFDCQVGTVIEHHIPEKIEPIEDNTISDLKQM